MTGHSNAAELRLIIADRLDPPVQRTPPVHGVNNVAGLHTSERRNLLFGRSGKIASECEKGWIFNLLFIPCFKLWHRLDYGA